ncbi:hypothetical protein RFI_05471 [Reticulomyxa filosa]|uniref:Uncharacterized protein n=1 Tax=Reticulomyxa filosa TaxID=46433 RepID=X6P263_RETFI|nr:hypothetical protein RFI_05471 [Reticulomyxa filosa]|eukprot:ETO31647.1 hypothetical protein RFI_05471 [Reticulomyxa filosa]
MKTSGYSGVNQLYSVHCMLAPAILTENHEYVHIKKRFKEIEEIKQDVIVMQSSVHIKELKVALFIIMKASLLQTRRTAQYGSGMVTDVQFSPNDQFIAFSSFGTTNNIWNLHVRGKVDKLCGHDQSVIRAHTILLIWDAMSHTEIKKLTGYSGPVNNVKFFQMARLLYHVQMMQQYDCGAQNIKQKPKYCKEVPQKLLKWIFHLMEIRLYLVQIKRQFGYGDCCNGIFLIDLL